jgi:hypothetical protein
VKVKYLRCIRGTLVVASRIYGNLSVMSRSSDFWESIDNRWSRLLTVSIGGFTTYNTGVTGFVVYVRLFLGGSIFFNFVKSRTPILAGKFPPPPPKKKCGLYTRKYGRKQIQLPNLVFFPEHRSVDRAQKPSEANGCPLIQHLHWNWKDNEPSNSINGGEFLEFLKEYQLLKKLSVSRK